MKRLSIGLAVFAAAVCFSSLSSAKERIREFKGTSSKTTADFEVVAPWIADWRARGDYPGQMAMSVNLINAKTGEYVGKIATTKYVTNGVRLFHEGGTYRFQVDSSLVNWTLRVEQLTRAEAETYKPKEPYE